MPIYCRLRTIGPSNASLFSRAALFGLLPWLARIKCSSHINLFHRLPQALAIPAPSDDPNRCAVENLKKFAGVRASFSAEISSGALPEAMLDLRGCTLSGLNLKNAVLSGAILTGADFSKSNLEHVEMSRVTAKSGNFQNVRRVCMRMFSFVQF